MTASVFPVLFMSSPFFPRVIDRTPHPVRGKKNDAPAGRRCPGQPRRQRRFAQCGSNAYAEAARRAIIKFGKRLTRTRPMPAALWMRSVEGPAEQRGPGRWARATRAPGKATAPAMSHRSRSGAYMGLARALRKRGGRGDARGARRLDIEVERVLPRMRAEPHGVHLVLALVVDPRLDHVRREDVALQQPVVGLLEVVEHDAEVAGELLDLLRLGGRQLAEVLVDRLTRIDLVGDPVEPRHQARSEQQIRV